MNASGFHTHDTSERQPARGEPARASNAFGDTLEASWANYDGTYTYGAGRKGIYRQRPVPLGAFGLVNRWGLAEMHGQFLEWCADQWHRDPVEGAVGNGSPLEGSDQELEGNQEQTYRLLRGGSCFGDPVASRAALRDSYRPVNLGTDVGVRPGCFSPPAPFTARAVGRDSSGSARRVTDPRVQTRGSRPAPVIGDNCGQDMPRTSGCTIRTAPAHCSTAIEPG